MAISDVDVYVFPSVQKNTVKSRSFTEENVANLIYNFVCRDVMGTNGSPSRTRYGFVITDTGVDAYNNPKPYDPEDSFELNILGYYFKIDGNIASGYNTSEDVYASIKISPSTYSGSEYNELFVGDAGSDYEKGIKVENTNTDPTNTEEGIYGLKILTYSNSVSDWVIPDDSKIRFNPSTVGLDVIDGGEW